MLTREQKYGRILAIADVLGKMVGLQISANHSSDMRINPSRTLERINFELTQHATKFEEHEMVLLDMMGEIIASLDAKIDFTSAPLESNYLQAYYSKHHELYNTMGTYDASVKWDLAQDYIKRLCREGKLKAYKVGRNWYIDRDQPSPKKKTEKEPE